MDSKIFKTWLELQQHVPRKNIFGIIALIFLSGVLEIVGLGAILPILGILVDTSKLSEYHHFFVLKSIPQEYLLLSLLIFIIIFYIVKNIFLGFSTYKIFQSVFRLQDYFSKTLYRNLLYAKYDSHRNLNINKQSSLLVNDIPLVCIQWYLPFIYIISDATTLLIIFICLAAFNPYLLIIVLLIGGSILGAIVFFSKKYSYKWGVNRKNYDDVKLDYFLNGLHHIKEVITYNKLEFYLDKFSYANSRSAKSGLLQSTAQIIPKFFIESVAIIVLVVVIFTLLARGQAMQVVIPTIGLYAIAAFRIIPSINRIMQSVQMVQFGLEPTLSLLSLVKNKEIPLLNQPLMELSIQPFKSLSLMDICYTYPNSSKLVINHLSLSILYGKKIAIVGDSGSGKSTLIDIMLGLNEPSSGSVLFNNGSIFPNINSWRSRVGYVPQQSHLTSNSLLENITFSNQHNDIDYTLLDTILDLTEIRKFMIDGYELSVGHGGVKISGGQKQRIAIARALYRNPSVLILDEATSALDKNSEARILSGISSLLKGVTIISITHHLHDENFYDEIYFLKNGCLHKQ